MPERHVAAILGEDIRKIVFHGASTTGEPTIAKITCQVVVVRERAVQQVFDTDAGDVFAERHRGQREGEFPSALRPKPGNATVR